MTDKIDGYPVEDGWLMRYSNGQWIRYMPVTEWRARTQSIAQVNAAKTLEEKRQLLAQGQKAARARRRKWAKEL